MRVGAGHIDLAFAIGDIEMKLLQNIHPQKQ
jgi:hypothetical protein